MKLTKEKRDLEIGLLDLELAKAKECEQAMKKTNRKSGNEQGDQASVRRNCKGVVLTQLLNFGLSNASSTAFTNPPAD